eukprot:scaffold193574_cov31-Tisochrysis_lutea.AAC.1
MPRGGARLDQVIDGDDKRNGEAEGYSLRENEAEARGAASCSARAAARAANQPRGSGCGGGWRGGKAMPTTGGPPAALRIAAQRP